MKVVLFAVSGVTPPAAGVGPPGTELSGLGSTDDKDCSPLQPIESQTDTERHHRVDENRTSHMSEPGS